MPTMSGKRIDSVGDGQPEPAEFVRTTFISRSKGGKYLSFDKSKEFHLVVAANLHMDLLLDYKI